MQTSGDSGGVYDDPLVSWDSASLIGPAGLALYAADAFPSLDGSGVDRLDPGSGRIVHYRHDADDPASLGVDQVTSLVHDRDGGLWVGTIAGGLHRLGAGMVIARASSELYAQILRDVGADRTVLGAAVDSARESITEGASIAAPLRRSGHFPPLVTHMVDVGERSGELEAMLARVADTYDEEVRTLTDGLMALLEPLLICFLGGAVGFIVISLFLPLVAMIQGLS